MRFSKQLLPLAGALTGIVLALGACSGSSDTPSSPPASPTAAASSTSDAYEYGFVPEEDTPRRPAYVEGEDGAYGVLPPEQNADGSVTCPDGYEFVKNKQLCTKGPIPLETNPPEVTTSTKPQRTPEPRAS